jgi:N-formylmaleamate deformylase
MSATPSFFCPVNGIDLHVYRSTPSAGGPPVLLLHGMTDNAMAGWGRIAGELCDRYDLVMPDQRGHGQSAKPAAGYRFEDFAADAAGLIDALGLDRPVVMGQSMGGMITTAFAALYPEKTRGVVLVEPGWFPREPTSEERAGAAEANYQNLIEMQSMTPEALIERARQEEPLWPEEELVLWPAGQLQASPDAVRQIVLSYRNAWRETLPAIRCPILLMTVEKDGQPGLVSPEMAAEARALNPLVREVHFTNCGHCIHRDAFEPCVREMKIFLQESFQG